MTYGFLDRLASPGVQAAREANGVGDMWERMDLDLPQDCFYSREADFLATRDSFYIASISQTGWPYIQHRGGPPGFLRLIDERTLGFADFRGNRQYLTLGHLADDDRVALFVMDYPRRRRMKILAHMSAHDLTAEPDFAAQLAMADYRGVAERGFRLRLEAFDWNCPQHITPRFTQAEVEEAIAPLQARVRTLEAECRRLGGSEETTS